MIQNLPSIPGIVEWGWVNSAVAVHGLLRCILVVLMVVHVMCMRADVGVTFTWSPGVRMATGIRVARLRRIRGEQGHGR